MRQVRYAQPKCKTDNLCLTERPIYSSESEESEGSGLDDSRSKRLTKAKKLEDSADNVSHHDGKTVVIM